MQKINYFTYLVTILWNEATNLSAQCDYTLELLDTWGDGCNQRN